MKDLTKKLEKEFDELVKIQDSLLNPKPFNSMSNLLNLLGIKPDRTDDYLKLHSLSDNKYHAVVSAYDAIKLYGKGEIGMKIYDRNKKAYVNICLSKL